MALGWDFSGIPNPGIFGIFFPNKYQIKKPGIFWDFWDWDLFSTGITKSQTIPGQRFKLFRFFKEKNKTKNLKFYCGFSKVVPDPTSFVFFLIFYEKSHSTAPIWAPF